MVQHIYIDLTKLEHNDRKAYVVFGAMEQTGEFIFTRGTDPLTDPRLEHCQIFATNIAQHAESITEIYPDKSVFLIERPLNRGYKSTKPNLHVVWCWDDFQFFVYFPRKS
jgi:hypothetical protein